MAQLRITVKGPDEELQSFLGRVAAMALGLALTIQVEPEMAKTTAATKTARREPEVAKARMGRPAPLIPKEKHSVYLDTQIWENLGALQRKNGDPSLSVTLNRLLRQALSLDVAT